MKKRTISFMLVFVLIVQICTIPVQANILQYIFYEDFENNILPTSFAYEKSFGKIEVCKIGTRNALFLNHDYDGTAMYATANFEAINDGTLTAKAIVMQPDKKSDGEVLFSLFDNTGVAISVETQNGNIMLKKADGTYTLIEENYFYNKWYTISAEANLVTDTADVYINGQLKIDDEPFINQMSSVSGIQFSSKTAPGFMIDSVELSNETYFAGFEILGKAEQAVPLHEAIDYIYSANLKTTGGLEAKTNFVWKLVSPVDGVSITANENSKTAKLTVEPRVAIGTEITIEASVEGQPQANSTFTVKLIEASASEIVIEGDSHISTPVGEKTEFFYQAISWSLENNTSATIDFSIENKSMSVSGTMPDKDEFIYLTASLTSNPSIKATKKILIQPYDLYFSDVQRMDIVQKSIDNLLKAASAKESDSPLLALYFSPYTDSYGTWHWSGGYTNLSDLSEHFGLMRALKGLTGLTGDDKYYNRVKAIYDWTWEKCKTPNGLIYWGHHLFCDAFSACYY